MIRDQIVGVPRDLLVFPRRGSSLPFGAEQGFAGAFAEQVLDATEAEFAAAQIFLVGSRSTALAAERGLAVDWRGELTSRASAVPHVATEITPRPARFTGFLLPAVPS